MKDDIRIRLNKEAAGLAAHATKTRWLLQEAVREIVRLRNLIPYDSETRVLVYKDVLAELKARSARVTLAERVAETANHVRHYPKGWAGMFKKVTVDKRYWDKLSCLLEEYENFSLPVKPNGSS